ncbi:MAG: DUF3341 domain-containing protein [Candidatus Acidiferrales bacterium]
MSDNKKTAVFGIYSTRDGVERATDALLQSGFTANDISVLLPESLGNPSLAGSGTATTVSDVRGGSTVVRDTTAIHDTGAKDMGTVKNTKAPEGATTGAGTGAVIGGTLGLLAGIGALAIPGVGPLIAAGPIMAALAGIGVGGAVGGFTGALIGMGIPEFEAKKYEGRLKKGGILFSVHCDTSDQIKRAKEIMQRTGGEDVSSTGESSVKNETTADRDARKIAAGGSN